MSTTEYSTRRPALAWLTGLCLALLLSGCGRGEESVFSETLSPDGAWVLRVTVAQSRMPQGPFYVSAYLAQAEGDNTAPVKVVESKLENDGVPFTNQNIAARWTGARAVLLCLRATDRPDKGWRISAGPSPAAEAVDSC